MTEPRATAFAAENDDEGEQTTRPLLSSGNRMKASKSVSVDTRDSSREAITGDVPGIRSEARMSLRSSRQSSSDEEQVASVAPIRVTQEHTRLGPYQIVCELAAGGMATVYLALYRSIEGFEKLCAVKRIHPHLASAREFTNMFADEAQIAARISHPFVCSVFSFGRSQQSHFIAMEFLRGEPLSVVSRRVARAPEIGDDPRFPAIAARLLANFAEGLHAAHVLRDDRGALLEVVHRDITPQNLFVLYDGTVRVTDFGIAHARRRLHHTEGQKLKGKLSYVAPEQLKEGKVDLRVDVWGLGVTLWELLAGRRLFLGASEGETLSAVMSRVVPAPSTFRASVPAELDRIVLRALERDIDKRYRSARDFSRDLEKFLTGIGDTVPSMDLADWMTTLCPQGGERIQTLVEMAARVSAATADDTVMRIPSSPPATGSDSYAIPVARNLSDYPSSPPTREYPASIRQAAAAAEELSASPQQRSAMSSKPRLLLVEETTQSSDLPAHRKPEPESESGRGVRRFVLAGAALLSLSVGAVLLWRKPATPHPVVARPPVAASPAPTANLGHAPSTAPSGALPLPLALDAVPIAAKRKSAAVSPPARAAAALSSAAAPASAAILGDVFITTPGGTGQVFEQSQLLGPAPGRFRLSAGAHELSLRTPSGAVHTVRVNIKPGAPTLVTVNVAQ